MEYAQYLRRSAYSAISGGKNAAALSHQSQSKKDFLHPSHRTRQQEPTLPRIHVPRGSLLVTRAHSPENNSRAHCAAQAKPSKRREQGRQFRCQEERARKSPMQRKEETRLLIIANYGMRGITSAFDKKTHMKNSVHYEIFL